MLAQTSNAIIVGFNVRPDAVAQAAAERDGVDMRMYRVIYDCIEEIEAAMKGMLAPKYRENQMATIEVRNVYKISNVGTVAGCYVTNGKVTRACQIRVVREGIVIYEDKIDSLRRFKDDVKEVAQGYECGISLEKFADIKEGDVFEAFVMEEYRD
jgi:translation initiation factor IF-2